MENKLTIEHLKGYLGTGLKALNCHKEAVEILGLQYGSSSVSNELWKYKNKHRDYLSGYLYECKPILYPLSTLTEFREDLGFVPIIELAKIATKLNNNFWEINNNYKSGVSYDDNFFIFGIETLCFGWCKLEDNFYPDFNQLELFKKLYEWHFDIHGLIKQGLAIDINTLTK